MSLFRGEGDGSVPIRTFIEIQCNLAAENLPAGGYWMFVADHNYTLVAVREIHSVAGGAAYNLAIRKIQVDGTAPNAAAGANVIELLPAAGLVLTGAANTAQVVVPTTVSAIQKGDRIAFNFTGTSTAYIGSIQVELQAAQ